MRILGGAAQTSAVSVPTASTVDEGTVSVGDQPIHYLTAGDADPTLVLLHGGIIDAAAVSWGDHVDPLADEATVLAPDLPGYGGSPVPAGPLSVPRHVNYVEGFLDALDVDDAVVAGISMGGGIAIGLGLQAPDRVEHVVAVDSYGLGRELASGSLTWVLARIQVTNHISVALLARSRAYTEWSLRTLVHDADSIDDTFVDRVMAEARRPDAGRAFRKFRAGEVTRTGYRTVYTDRLTDLTVPLRLVHGRQDPVFPVEWSQRAHERVADSTLFVLDDCGHLPPIESDRTGELIAEVL